jgi:hypothetical protein
VIEAAGMDHFVVTDKSAPDSTWKIERASNGFLDLSGEKVESAVFKESMK